MKLIEFIAHCVRQRPRLCFVFLLLLTAVTGAALYFSPPRSTWDDAAKGRGQSDIQRDDASAYDLRGSDCFLVVEVEDLYNQRTVSALRQMVERLEALPQVGDVNWIDRVPVSNAFGLPQPVLPPNDASEEHFAEARRRVQQHPLIAGQLISPDEKTLLMPVTLDWLNVQSNEDASANLLAAARDALPEDSDIRVRLTGGVPLFVEYQIAFDRGHRRYMIISMIVSFTLAVLIFRGITPVLIVVGAPAMGVLWTEGILKLVNEPSNPLGNIVLPVLLLMVGMTDSVHLLMQIRRARVAGASPAEAAANGVRHVGMACLLTSITTAIGFGSLMLAQSELVQGFGRACAIGVMTTFVAVILIVPLSSMTRLGRNFDRGVAKWSLIDSPWLDGPWIVWIIRRRWAVALAGVTLMIGLTAVSGQLRPDEKMSSYQPESSEAFQALHHCDRAFGGLDFVQVSVRWSDSIGPLTDDAASRRIIEVVQEVEQLVRDEQLLSEPLSLNDVLATFPGDGPIETRMNFIELMPPSLQRFLIRREQRVTFVSSRVQDLGIAAYRPVFERLEGRLRELSETHPEFNFQMEGVPIRRGRELFSIVWDLVASLGTASIVILAVMTLAFRSWRIGLVTILPNTLPLAVTGAILWSMGESLELASVCSFTVCLGIAVDDTIHFLTHFRQQSERGQSVEDAIRGAVRSVGGSLVVTTVILVAGFSVVLTSELPGQRIFAAMACATISSALIGDLIFLPALLAIFGRRQPDAVTTATSEAQVEPLPIASTESS